MADEFFQRFNVQLAGPAPVGEEALVVEKGPWLTGMWVFIAAFIVAFIIIWLAS
jgi:hypothetical protein